MIKPQFKALVLIFSLLIGAAFADSTIKLSNLGIGFSSFGGGSLSGITKIGENNQVQAYLSISSSNPLNLTLGAIYRNLINPKTPGLHYGAGVDFGSMVGTFFFNIKPLIGMHLNLPGNENVQFSIDGGANISLTPSFNLAIGSLGQMPFASGSIHYFF